MIDRFANSIRTAELAAGCCGHSRRLGHDHLDGCGRMEALQMGQSGPDSVFRVGLDCDRAATLDHSDELVRNTP